MKAAVFNGKKVVLKEVPKPFIDKNQVLIRVQAVGICGTDLAIVEGTISTPIPIILGHEFAGDVIDEKTDSDISWIGKRITAEINTNICHQCYFCKRNVHTQCLERKALGIHINGAMADYLAIDVNLLHELPPSVSYEEATFIEPLAAAYQTFEMMPIDSDDRMIAIFGMGKLGLLLLQIAKNKGLETIVVDGSEKKLALARQLGADHLINRHDNVDISRIIKNMCDNGADIVVDTSGSPQALKDIVLSCRSRGKIHIKSTHGVLTPINITKLVQQEITLYTSRCGPFGKAIQGLESEKIKVNPLISQTYPLEKVEEAFKSYRKNRDHIRTIVTMT
ncbi:MAG: zinc-binding dehydrogenase [Candidatus Thorarchaeota archaeon]